MDSSNQVQLFELINPCPVGRSEKPKSWKSKNGQADYLPRHRIDGIKECWYEIQVEQLGVKVDHLLLESLLLLLLLDVLLPLDLFLLTSLSPPPSPFFPRRSLRGTGGSRRGRSRSRFQNHLVLILPPPVVLNLLLRIDADFKAILFSIFFALCSTCFFPRSSSERRRRNRDKSPLQVRMKRLFPCFKSCFNCSGAQEKQEQRSARRSKR